MISMKLRGLWTVVLYDTFKIHIDASTFQLGAVFVHKGKPIALYIRKLTDARQSYTVTEQKILITVETLI